jgi:ribosomal protein S8
MKLSLPVTFRTILLNYHQRTAALSLDNSQDNSEDQYITASSHLALRILQRMNPRGYLKALSSF